MLSDVHFYSNSASHEHLALYQEDENGSVLAIHFIMGGILMLIN